METLLTRILAEIKIPYTKNFSEDLYKEPPYCYTLYGLQQMLSRYKVKTTTKNFKTKVKWQNLTIL